MKKIMLALMVVLTLGLFNFNLAMAEEPKTGAVESTTVMAAQTVISPLPGETLAPAPAKKTPLEEVKFYLGIAAGIFLMIWPIARLFVTDAATRTALDAWAAIIAKLRIAKDPKTINDLLLELKAAEATMPARALKQWKKATAKANGKTK